MELAPLSDSLVDRDSNPPCIFRSARSAHDQRRGAQSRRDLGDISRLVVAQRGHGRAIRRVVSELGEIVAQRVEAEDLPTWTWWCQ